MCDHQGRLMGGDQSQANTQENGVVEASPVWGEASPARGTPDSDGGNLRKQNKRINYKDDGMSDKQFEALLRSQELRVAKRRRTLEAETSQSQVRVQAQVLPSFVLEKPD